MGYFQQTFKLKHDTVAEEALKLLSRAEMRRAELVRKHLACLKL